MKRKRAYLFTVEDASRLERIATVKLSPLRVTAFALCALAVMLCAGVLVVMATPLKGLLPGYMKADQRAATEMGLLRLDSLSEVNRQRDLWVANVRRVLDTDRAADILASPDSLEWGSTFEPDSLLGSSERERRFVASMHEREKYNISVLAPLAAEELTFVPPAREAMVRPDRRDPRRALISTGPDIPVCAVAEGRVVMVSRGDGSSSVMIQHDNGFLSRYGLLDMPAVSEGDYVEASQPVALRGSRQPDGSLRATLEMWHDGVQLEPYRYIKADPTPPEP